MAILQIRDIPEDIYFELSEEAKRQHRSLSQQAVITLAKGLEVATDAAARRREILDRLSQQKPGKSKLPSPVDLVREDRER